MNDQRIVLAFNGHPASCAAVKWLADANRVRLTPFADAAAGKKVETATVDVIALIVDVGQGDDPEELYGRALACGAHRVHVLDRCDDFAARVIVPTVASLVSLDTDRLRRLTYPIIAAALVEVAAVENTDIVAHASIDPALDAQITAFDPALRVLAPARDWRAQKMDLAEFVKSRRLSTDIVHPQRHLLMRRPAASTSASDVSVTIGFDAGVPRSVNGVEMELPELIESLSLIGGQYHVGAANSAPALVLLQQAYRQCAGDGSATLTLQATPELVNQA